MMAERRKRMLGEIRIRGVPRDCSFEMLLGEREKMEWDGLSLRSENGDGEDCSFHLACSA